VKILVTGATGFIGRRLVEHLLVKGHSVACLVRMTSDVGFLKERGARLIIGDVGDEVDVSRAFRDVEPEAVFHCAALVMSKASSELNRNNVEGTLNICRASLWHGVRKLVYLSSVAVISGNLGVPLTEDLPYKASDAYGRSKIAAERIVMDFRERGLNVAVIRPSMVYGEEEPHVLDRILNMVKRRHIPVFDVPEMDSKLHLVYVGNVVKALDLALEKDESTIGTFMIADKEVITLRRFLEILYDEMGLGGPPLVSRKLIKLAMMVPPVRRKLERIFKDRVYDITHATEVLGYDPSMSTEEGLRKAVRHWKEKDVTD